MAVSLIPRFAGGPVRVSFPPLCRWLSGSKLTHVNAETNAPTMVDVSAKSATLRVARARSVMRIPRHVMEELSRGSQEITELQSAKGPVFSTAIVAGTMAVKRTSDLIPFCHPLPIDSAKFVISTERDLGRITIECEVKVHHTTGVEMEALTGASVRFQLDALSFLTAVQVAALCVYDMVKALSHEVVIEETRLLTKTGGKSGTYTYTPPAISA